VPTHHPPKKLFQEARAGGPWSGKVCCVCGLVSQNPWPSDGSEGCHKPKMGFVLIFGGWEPSGGKGNVCVLQPPPQKKNNSTLGVLRGGLGLSPHFCFGTQNWGFQFSGFFCPNREEFFCVFFVT